MNANAYGGELASVIEWVSICGPGGAEHRTPHELGFRYRKSDLRPGEVVSRASFALAEADPDSVKATLAEMRGRRREAQPSGIKTFGSTFKNPDDPRAEGLSAGRLLDSVGASGLTVGGARFSEKHANFVENMGSATTADVLALMSAGPQARPRALRHRPGARGPGARTGRVALRLGAGLGRRAKAARERVPDGLFWRFDSGRPPSLGRA